MRERGVPFRILKLKSFTSPQLIRFRPEPPVYNLLSRPYTFERFLFSFQNQFRFDSGSGPLFIRVAPTDPPVSKFVYLLSEVFIL